jgi:branched-chain amino acid transport system permease protein
LLFPAENEAGYYWQAIRENEEAAQALGHQHFPLEGVRGGARLGDDRGGGRVLRLLLQQPLPEQIFNISRSIEIILGPIIGGLGTLFGPILGAAVLTLLSGRHHRAPRPRWAGRSPA